MALVGHIELVKDAGNWHTLSMKVNFDGQPPEDSLKQIGEALIKISDNMPIMVRIDNPGFEIHKRGQTFNNVFSDKWKNYRVTYDGVEGY